MVDASDRVMVRLMAGGLSSMDIAEALMNASALCVRPESSESKNRRDIKAARPHLARATHTERQVFSPRILLLGRRPN
jgi:hypothetical protein